MKTQLILIFLLVNLTGLGQTKGEFKIDINHLYQEQSFEEGINKCDEAIAKYNDEGDFYYLKAVGMINLDGGFPEYSFSDDSTRYHEILAVTNQALSLDSTNLKFIYLRGQLNFYYYHFDEAVADFDKGFELSYTNSKRIKFLTYKMQTVYYMGDTLKTLEIGNQIIELDPLNTDIIVNVSTSYFKFNLYREAEQILLRADKNDPENEAVLSNLGYISLMTGNYKRAIAFYDQAEDAADYKSYTIYSNRGYCYVMIGKYKKGLKEINKSLKLNPKNAFAFKYRAIYYIKTDQPEKACEDLNTALEYGYALWDDEVDLLIEQHCK